MSTFRAFEFDYASKLVFRLFMILPKVYILSFDHRVVRILPVLLSVLTPGKLDVGEVKFVPSELDWSRSALPVRGLFRLTTTHPN